MNNIVRLCALLTLAVVLSGQAKSGNRATIKGRTPVVQIGDHRLDETFSEWLAIEKIDLVRACLMPDPPIKKADVQVPDSIPEYQRNDYREAEVEYDKHVKEDLARLLCKELRPIKLTGSGFWHDRRGLPADTEVGTRWTFANGKLVEKQDVYSTEFATKELGFLKEAYGSPALTTKIPQQNAFGAKWNDVLMTWHLAGGATLYMKASGGPSNELVVTFISKEYANAPLEHDPNPYLPKPPR